MLKIKDRYQVRFSEKYGDIKANVLYTVIDEGYDWVMVSFRGGNICVPKIFLGDKQKY